MTSSTAPTLTPTLTSRRWRLASLLSLLASIGLAQAQTAAPAPNPVLQRAAAEPGAVVTDSGLVFRELKAGTGAKPAATDTVRVHYRGTFPDGKEFDSSHSRGQPASFPLNRVIRCWTEGVQRIGVGGSAKLTCPPAIAYGDRGAGNVIPPGATLVFEVQLLAIEGK
jgi:FKBP-type peptidyl-prolyl cis-trans isomerase FkpA